jgi:DNA-directed RNA polymerase I, II, and III subunit RPABC2
MEDEDYIIEEDYDEEFFEDIEELEDDEADIEIEEELYRGGEDVEGKEAEIKITSKYLSKYEKTRILGIRALQISTGSPPTIDIGNETDALKIAEMELLEKKIPIVIRRYLPNGKYEDWKANELSLIE